MLEADLIYEQCAGQMIEIISDRDTWAFLGQLLIIDMGGTDHPGETQVFDLDRGDFTDGEIIRLRIFYASRSSGNASFALKLNGIELSTVPLVGFSGSYD